MAKVLERETALAVAEELLAHGVAVHWLRPRQKKPIEPLWSELRVHTVETLRESYRTGANLGLRLGEPSRTPAGYLHLIDLDIRDPAHAPDAWAALVALWPGARTFPMVASGSRGESRHIYFVSPEPFRSRKLAVSEGFEMVPDPRTKKPVKKRHWEIELFGTGKQAVLPPSIHPDTDLPYDWLKPLPLDEMDLGVGREISTALVTSWGAIVADDQDNDSPEAVKRRQALGMKLGRIEKTIYGLPDDWVEEHDDWIKVGMGVHHETKGSPEGYAIWRDWSKQSAKFKERDTRARWKSFDSNEKNPVTMRSLVKAAAEYRAALELAEMDDLDDLEAPPAPARKATKPKPRTIEDDLADLLGTSEPDGPDEEEEDDDDEDDTPVSDEPADKDERILFLNNKHAVVSMRGKSVILTEKNGQMPDFSDERSLNILYANIRVKKPGLRKEPIYEPISAAWLRHPERRTYKRGLVFRPTGKVPRGAYNVWCGWRVKPDPTASCDLFLDHLRNVVCHGDEAHFLWVCAWLADLVQNPGCKPGTALVLKGRKGAGKDTVGTYVGRLLGPAYLNTEKAEDVFGDFNAMIGNKLLLHLEEAFFGGDHRLDSAAKALVTKDRVTLNEKYLPKVEVESHHRLIVTSNDFMPVNATDDERRWFIAEVSNDRLGDRAYFDAVYAEMKGRGPAALMHFLLNFDLTGHELRFAPRTQAAAEQIEEGMSGVDAWWRDVLHSGALPTGSDLLDEPDQKWEEGEQWVSSDAMRRSFLKWRDGKERWTAGRGVGDAEFGRLIGRFGLDKKRASKGSRPWGYVLPPLQECRDLFAARIGGVGAW